jgi:GPI mannosyltransferase 3
MARSRAVLILLALFCAGILLRALVAFDTIGMYHPDEHQQYVEQANHIAFGFGIQFWEQERGVRNLVYPTMLATLLKVIASLGVYSSLLRAGLLRMALATVILAGFSAYALRLYSEGSRVTAILFMGLASLLPDMVYINIRFLSENAMMLPLTGVLICYGRRPILAGISAGVMFAIRFQSVLLIVVFCMLSLVDDLRELHSGGRVAWRAKSLRFGLGLVVSCIVLVGAYDRINLGGWFHSPIEYYRVCIVDGGAAQFGVEPWYRYLDWAGCALMEACVVSLPLFVFGIIRQWRLAVLALVFLAGHAVIAHKEFRFIWGAMPLVLVVMAAGIESLWKFRAQWGWRSLVVLILVLSFGAGIVIRADRISWNTEPFRSTARALNWVGFRSDLNGVVLFGVPPFMAGNYFYLGRNVPLVEQKVPDAAALASDPHVIDGSINYLVARADDAKSFASWRPRKVATFGQLDVFRVWVK